MDLKSSVVILQLPRFRTREKGSDDVYDTNRESLSVRGLVWVIVTINNLMMVGGFTHQEAETLLKGKDKIILQTSRNFQEIFRCDDGRQADGSQAEGRRKQHIHEAGLLLSKFFEIQGDSVKVQALKNVLGEHILFLMRAVHLLGIRHSPHVHVRNEMQDAMYGRGKNPDSFVTSQVSTASELLQSTQEVERAVELEELLAEGFASPTSCLERVMQWT